MKLKISEQGKNQCHKKKEKRKPKRKNPQKKK